MSVKLRPYQRQAIDAVKRDWQGGIMKTCGRCGKEQPASEFYRNRTRKDGYDHRCKTCCKSHKRAHNAICQTCGRSFYAGSSSYGLYCSPSCSGKARDRKVSARCQICEKAFKVHRCKVEAGEGKFCSRSCAMAARNGSNCASWKGGPARLHCETCGKTFEAKPYRAKEARFCPTECKGVWQSEEIRGENHPNWQGGYSLDGYPSEWNEKFRQSIRDRDGYTCAVCGEWGNHVHHINYIKEDTTPSNCITLCVSCHSKTNFRRRYWAKVLAGIIAARGEV